MWILNSYRERKNCRIPIIYLMIFLIEYPHSNFLIKCNVKEKKNHINFNINLLNKTSHIINHLPNQLTW